MFTGLIEEIGIVRKFNQIGERYDLQIQAETVTEELEIDDSISVNGVCLTVVELGGHGFKVQVVPQTVRKSSLRHLRINQRVNLERAMAAGGRFGGHFVQGHVDGTAELLKITQIDDYATMEFRMEEGLSKYCVNQGSIAVDGVSLTIANIDGASLEIAVIPHTLRMTTLGSLRQGDEVNIEVDMLSKYIERHLQQKNDSSMSLEWLQKQGF